MQSTSHDILVSLQLQCTGNGQTTIQLPELSPEPAGPETHLEYQTKDEVPGEHSTIKCFLKSISPWWTLVSLILSFSQHLKYFTDIILEALGLFDWCSHDCVVCCNELPTSQLDDGNSMGNDQRKRPDHLEKKNKDELPLHTHADTASVSSFQLPLEGRRFCSTTRHSVHSYQDWIHDKR